MIIKILRFVNETSQDKNLERCKEMDLYLKLISYAD